MAVAPDRTFAPAKELIEFDFKYEKKTLDNPGRVPLASPKFLAEVPCKICP
jgi:hypothetical protein